MRQLWLHLTGADHPGILGRVMDRVVELDLVVTELEHVSVGGRVNFELAVDAPAHITETFTGLTDLGPELGLTVVLREEPLSPANPDDLQLVVTLLGEPVPARALAAVGNTLGNHNANIQRVETLARRRLHCIEMQASIDPAERESLATELLSVSTRYDVDIAVQEEGLGRRTKRLVVMDVDSTLIQSEVIDELADVAGVGERVAEITHRAMNGELDFHASLRERLALLKGLPVSALDEVEKRLTYTPGTRSLVRVLKEMGYKIAILSGGFTHFVDRFKEELGLDYAYASELEIKDGHLTGQVVGTPVDGERKAALVKEIAEAESIRLNQVIVIGDGANDLPMMGLAGLGIAFNAKPRVREMAPYNINRKGLDSILFLLGVSEQEIEQVEALSGDNQ